MNQEFRPSGNSASSFPRKPAPKGHDTVLGAIQNGGRSITVELISGEVVTGKLVGRDKYTVTVRPENTQNIRKVIYKHAIESFYGEEPADESRGA